MEQKILFSLGGSQYFSNCLAYSLGKMEVLGGQMK
ncbi:Uncharacterised protein [Streptococcus agalactiae]|nr:Uncharacterised protein [Streptococcus agalactiae]